ncbi:MAG: hypothetical protein HQK57_03905 [Deltaproteobacteria bacterium]|nr:hypothetical protein [Deltaproteobacteria bacterium]
MRADGKSQQEVADELGSGWSKELVKKYDSLQKISPEAWQIVFTTTSQFSTNTNEEAVNEIFTMVNNGFTIFNERLLREIIHLTSDQQLTLVTKLAKNGKYTKADFKSEAANYAMAGLHLGTKFVPASPAPGHSSE